MLFMLYYVVFGTYGSPSSALLNHVYSLWHNVHSYFSASNGNSLPSGEGLLDNDGTSHMGMGANQGRNVRYVFR